MSNNEFDQDKALLVLHEKYQAEATETPPESIDISIITAAHSAVNSPPETNNELASAQLKKRNKQAWYVPVSYVAVIVLSLSVFLKLAFEAEPLKPEQFKPEQFKPEPRGVDFAEESFLPDVSRQYADKSNKASAEQKEITESRRQKIADSQKERLEVAARVKKKAKAESKKSLLLKQQAAPSSLTAAAPTKSEAVNDSAEIVAPMSLTALPLPVAEIESDAEPLQAATAQRESAKAVNEHQLEQINKLVALFESKQLVKLKAALVIYRENYPYNKEVDHLPRAIRAQEVRWEAEKQAKSLHN